MMSDLAIRLVPDELWEIVGPLIPEFAPRRQGGGTAPVDDRMVFTAIVYVLTSGCAWRHLPAEFGVSVPTAHRRFAAWSGAGLWPRLRDAVLEEPGTRGQLEWAAAIVEAATARSAT
ncbi:transposase [Actinomadura luteofluorescens]|uniref:Transposase n=2 Tax=Actinomadura luteofluorescens TaxID=46163 RepID=A0A7Y9JL24_9ACTN|nr:transposase [Actinomadura luteofluorescens]